ncbi:MAG TPA: hypothetical protein VD859_17040, partial [Nocardioides sp.]|nr:hypothetical protein [Nocardioides sp.]
VAPDDFLDVVLAGHVAHVLATTGPDGPGSLLEALMTARLDGAWAVGAAFPEPGDPVGLGGPRDLTSAALDAGEVVVAIGADVAWVPREVGRAVEWQAYDARRRMPPDLGDADRLLRAALLGAANRLAALDVARWRPEVADALHDLRAGVPLVAPPGVPARCVELAGRALHLRAVVDLALDDEGAAASAAEIAARRDALLPLAHAARHALTAACSPDGWPPA